MAEGDWPREERPRCRIGIHTGTATRTMEGYVGLDVHVAARVGEAAHDLAATLIGAAEVAREASGDHLVPWQQPLLEQAILDAEANLGDDYEARLLEGRRLTMSESIDLITERFETPDSEKTAVSA